MGNRCLHWTILGTVEMAVSHMTLWYDGTCTMAKL